MRYLITLLFLLASFISYSQEKYLTPFEKGNDNQSTTYEECIAYYQKLDIAFETISVKEMSKTDSGEPLHIVIFNPDKQFSFLEINKEKVEF